MPTNDLFSPMRLGPLELKNRMVMAPMTRNRAAEGNMPQAMNVEYYRQRASAGLIVTEGSQVSPQGVGYPTTPGIHSDEQVAGWRQVTDAVHGEGGLIFLQLWHVGRISHPSMQPDAALPVAPSAIRPRGCAFTYEGLQRFVTPRALVAEEMPCIASEYARAAAKAREAGFDGVEIHAANGYLIDQFLRDGSNRRDDAYGGSIGNRCRFLMEVTAAVSDVLGGDRVGVRLSPAGGFNDMSDSDPQALFNQAAAGLNRFGLAYLHLVEAVESVDSFDFRQIRDAFQGNYIACGEYDLERARTALESGDADLVAFGRPFLANPDLPERFRTGAPLNEPDMNSFYGGDERGYTDYPTLGA